MKHVLWLLVIAAPALNAQDDRTPPPKPKGGDNTVDRVRDLINGGDFEKAIALANEGLVKDPRQGILFALRAVARGKAGDDKGAEEDWVRAKVLGFDSKDPMRRPDIPTPAQPPRPPEHGDNELHGYLREMEPQILELLQQLQREKRFEEAAHIQREAMQRFMQLREAKLHNPEAYERIVKMSRLESKSQGLGARLRHAEGDDRGKIKDELKKVLDELFELREEARRKEVEELSHRLEQLKKQLDNRREKRDQIVEKRLKQLAGEQDDTDW